MDRKKEKRQVVIFLAITFVLTLALNFFFRAYMDRSVSTNKGAGIMMLIPALAMLLTRLITREGFKNLWLKQYVKNQTCYYLMGWFGPILIIAVSALLYYLIFPGHFDPTMSQAPEQFSHIRDNFAATLIVSFLPFHLVGNIWFGLGEEWGWRGYLLPKLARLYGPLPAVFISGAIWGLWHGPLTAIEQLNAGGGAAQVWMGVGMYVVSCCAFSMLFSYITLRCGSCIPAAIAHMYHNSFAGFPSLFCSSAAPGYGLMAFMLGGYLLVGLFCLAKLQRLHRQGALFPQPTEEAAALAAEANL